LGIRDPGSGIWIKPVSDPGSWIPDLGSRILDPGSRIPDLGSRISDLAGQKVTGSYMPDPDPQYCS
jgi:hypothetical protein